MDWMVAILSRVELRGCTLCIKKASEWGRERGRGGAGGSEAKAGWIGGEGLGGTHRRSARPARPAWPCTPCPPCRPSWGWSSSSAAPRATTATAAPPAPQVDDRMLGHVTQFPASDWSVGMPGESSDWSGPGSRQIVRDVGDASAGLATLRKPKDFGLGTRSPYFWWALGIRISKMLLWFACKFIPSFVIICQVGPADGQGPSATSCVAMYFGFERKEVLQTDIQPWRFDWIN